MFIDCTGNGSIGAWAGAEYRLGREASAEFRESLAPAAADKMHHGNTVVFLTENDIRLQRPFPDAVARCSGHFCLHYPGDEYDFRLGDWKWIAVQPYSVPFRCL
jgi:hypothetical protein